MTNPSQQTNPLDYPQYVRGLRPAMSESLGQYVDDELEKLQNAFDNAGVATDSLVREIVASSGGSGYDDTEIRSIVHDEENARIDADTGIAARTTLLETTVNSVTDGNLAIKARIATEETTRANADSALATRTSTLEARSGGGGNILTNTEFTTGTDGWTFTSETGSNGARDGLTASTWWPVGLHTLVIGQPNALTTRSGFWYQIVRGIDPGATYQATVYAAWQRCKTAILIECYNAAGTVIGTTEIQTVTGVHNAGSGVLSDYERVVNTFVAPSGTAYVLMYLAKYGTTSGTDSYAWFIRPQLIKVPATTTEAVPYTAGNNSAEQAATVASITAEESARIAQDGVIASSVSALSTTVGGHTATLSTYGSSINGLQLKYGVKLDSNGYVTGFEQNNNGTSGSFTVLADQFKVVKPSVPGSVPTVLFDVTASYVRFNGKLLVDGLQTGSLNGDMNVGTGRIIFDNGAFMKVSGVGFGTSNQFIEWFGPKMAITSCSEANAISYLKTNGSAYFGGTLNVGTLKNANQTTLLTNNASVTVGPFTTNGGSKAITLSYTYSRHFQCDHTTGTATATPTATVLLEKSTNGTTWTTMGTLSASGTGVVVVDADPTVKDSVDVNCSGSSTFTDGTAAGTMYLRATITARSVASNGSTIISNTEGQSVAVISIE